MLRGVSAAFAAVSQGMALLGAAIVGIAENALDAMSQEEEFAEALRQVYQIARFRLNDVIT